MHKIHEKEFTLEDFSTDKIIDTGEPGYENMYDDLVLTLYYDCEKQYYDPHDIFSEILIRALNLYRKRYLETKDKKYWWQMIQLLPSSYNQTRNVMMNYEVLANIYKSRHNHKLDEWVEFCKWIEELPYSELICGDGALMTPNEQREKLGMPPVEEPSEALKLVEVGKAAAAGIQEGLREIDETSKNIANIVADKFCEIGNINPLSKEEIEQAVNLSRIKE